MQSQTGGKKTLGRMEWALVVRVKSYKVVIMLLERWDEQHVTHGLSYPDT